MWGRFKEWIYSKKSSSKDDMKITTSKDIKNWEGEVGVWDYLEVDWKRDKSSVYKQGSYIGFDVVFGAVTGKLDIVEMDGRIIFKEWSREYDGRAPLYFKSKEHFKEQMNKQSPRTLEGCFYLPFH